MSCPDVEQRPAKKRRFFVEDPPIEDHTLYQEPALPDELDALPETSPSTHTRETSIDGFHPSSSQTEISTIQNGMGSVSGVEAGFDGGFDGALFESFIGCTVPSSTIQRLRKVAGNNLERAINMYLDGSWKNTAMAPTADNSVTRTIRIGTENSTNTIEHPNPAEQKSPPIPKTIQPHETMPRHRYVGAFGVGAWATRSGADLIKHGEAVSIERTKSKAQTKVGRGGKIVHVQKMNASKQRVDVIVRFTNTKGEEVGRLPKESATWVSTLIDQKVCHFEGICVFAPDRIRINDTIYLQLRCSLLRKAFESGSFIKPADNNRTTGIFEEKETSEEKDLRLRQVALVKLFDEINLHPSTVNETTTNHKRQGLLQAAEVAEQHDKEVDKKKPQSAESACSTSPADEETEDGKELEQDQLDTLYKKAQSFDFNTPTREPSDTFVMDLRKYQKQALYWMMGKEKDENAKGKELSMHPLWEEYSWPVKNVEDKDLPMVVNQNSFYVNPYSGELSLDFPVQEQHCLGGILADG